MLPIGFKNGGWLFSPLILVVCCFFETVGAIKLSQCALMTNIFTYQDLVEYAFGGNARILISIVVSILSFQFTLTPLSFFTMSL
mmetsp:Transcript_9583/g.16100  ORF Transcript_9583/g.16100 Transcript_9583/m.16100 type:complete len:84 (-) Transcript_9583:158-409(-)